MDEGFIEIRDREQELEKENWRVIFYCGLVLKVWLSLCCGGVLIFVSFFSLRIVFFYKISYLCTRRAYVSSSL